MTMLLDYLASAAICPMAILYTFILNDRWRISTAQKVIFMVAAGVVTTVFSPRMTAIPAPLRILLLWLVILPWLFLFSRARDARFVFVVTSGILFSHLSTAICGMLELQLGLHRALIRLLLDGIILLALCLVFRPVFQKVYHASHKGWWCLCLMPFSLLGIICTILLAPDYELRAALPYVQAFTYTMGAFSVIVYSTSFYFFRKLGTWHEGEVSATVLGVQINAMISQRVHQQADQENRRILRHDLRHYLPILSQCLQSGDAAAAEATLATMRTRIDELVDDPQQEVTAP